MISMRSVPLMMSSGIGKLPLVPVETQTDRQTERRIKVHTGKFVQNSRTYKILFYCLQGLKTYENNVLHIKF